MNSNQHFLIEIENMYPNQNMRQIHIRKLSKPEFFSNKYEDIKYEDISVLENYQNLNSSPMNMMHSKC